MKPMIQALQNYLCFIIYINLHKITITHAIMKNEPGYTFQQRHHKGELGQNASKRMNNSVCQGMLVNSRCPKDDVCEEKFIIGLVGGNNMVAIRG